MANSIATNDDNDIFLDGFGNLSIATGLDAVGQDCVHAVRALNGEMIFQQDEGMPYFQTVWDTKNIPKFQAALKKTLLNVPYVVKVLNLSTKQFNNTLKYSVDIETVYGKLYLTDLGYGLLTNNTNQ